jgi:hypothetical protein
MAASGIAPDKLDPKDFIISSNQIKGLTNVSAHDDDQDAEHELEPTEGEQNDASNQAGDINVNITDPIPTDLQDPAQSPSADRHPTIPPSSPPTVFVPSSSDPSSNRLGSPSPSAKQLDDPTFNDSDIVPPSSSLDIPFAADIVTKGKKRGTPDTAGSPGTRSLPFLQLSS